MATLSDVLHWTDKGSMQHAYVMPQRASPCNNLLGCHTRHDILHLPYLKRSDRTASRSLQGCPLRSVLMVEMVATEHRRSGLAFRLFLLTDINGCS